MTPDLPIPEAAIEAGAEAYWERMRYAPSEPDWRGLVAKDSEEAEVYREAALTVLAAALPHLRSLQVETQVEYGRALGRKEALEEFADTCGRRARFAERVPESIRSGVREGMIVTWLAAQRLAEERASLAAVRASEPRTDLPVGPNHPQDSQTAREAL